MDRLSNFKRYTVTSALPYANGPVHIGHLAGVYVPADIFVRFLRMNGEDVIFIGGSDEHGVPITIKALRQGVTPQEIVDRYHGMIKKSFEEFGISFDIYSRTSNKIHHETASAFFKKLYEDGKFIEKVSQQYYDEATGHFLADRYITGTCPHCGYDRAYGDQCEKCGTSLNATDLIEPSSVLSGNKPVLRDTKHWFLPLDQYEPWLREWILEGHKGDWKANVYGQCKSWIEQGLQPRAVTRDLDWGVKVPIDGADGKVLYVWFDAPIGYISATRELTPEWEKYWKDPETKLIHFIGKDNIVFHCIIFPAMLKAEGSYILPDNVPANEFLNLEGEKISTSRNWAVWLHEYLQEFPGKQDVLRYVLTSNAPETKDNDFTWKDFQTRNNSELVAILGNFINRTVVLTHKYFEGKVPAAISYTDADKAALEEMRQFPGRIATSLYGYRFREALTEVMNLARLGNKYLTDNEPWKKFSSDPIRVGTILNLSLQICAQLAIVAEPFLPFSAAKIRHTLNLPKFKWEDAVALNWLKEAQQLNQPELLFEKIEDSQIQTQIQKLLDTKKANLEAQAKPPVKPMKESIQYDDFVKMDIRVGTILEAEKVAKTDKLLKLKIDTGIDQRIVISGIAKYFKPEEIIGKRVCVLANLSPRKLKGIDSQGMILMAENPDGTLFFVAPPDDAMNGADIK
ncbi:MAG: methionine--tRNA ligase [Bacteroidales bacterium]|nr:methionine--tRNA ligase [Bacteroidales bacterium]MDD4602878.1 methionine--tRNA ligase [Bacteroidales bacterium]